MTFHYYVINRRLIIHVHGNEYLRGGGGLQLRSSYGRAATDHKDDLRTLSFETDLNLKVGVSWLNKPSFRQVKFVGRLLHSFSAHVVKLLFFS